MGIEANFRALSPDRYRALLEEEASAARHFLDCESEAHSESDSEAVLVLSLGKDWHALHFLLTGDARADYRLVPGPLGMAIMGGQDTKFDASYGMVRILEPDEVRAVAQALGQLSTAELCERIDVAAFGRHKIYPNPRPGGWGHAEIEQLVQFHFLKLLNFFEEAAKRGDVVLLSSD